MDAEGKKEKAGVAKRKVLMSLPVETADKIGLLAQFERKHVSEIVDDLIRDHIVEHVAPDHPLASALLPMAHAS